MAVYDWIILTDDGRYGGKSGGVCCAGKAD